MTKDYNSKMAIGVENDPVKFVSMGSIYTSVNENNHLLTYGLGPCVGVCIVIKSEKGDITRLLAHIDMGQFIGASFEDLKYSIQKLKNSIVLPVNQISISLVTTQSYENMNNLNDKETKLLKLILAEFKDYNVTINDINFSYSSQVQISPNGKIDTYKEEQLEQHKKNMMSSDLNAFGGYIHPTLNIYITNYGAFMGNCSLKINSSDEEKKAELSKNYWQKFITNGYRLTIAPSFNNPACLAFYVTNWTDDSIHKYGTIPGCIQAQTSNSLDVKPFKKR